MSNARIKDLGNGLKAEAVATDIHLRYDPATQSFQVDFHFQDVVTLADGTTIPGFTNGMYDMISVAQSALVTEKYGVGLVDPVSQLRLDNVTGAGVAAIIRAAADIVYNKRAAAMASGPSSTFSDAPPSPPED